MGVVPESTPLLLVALGISPTPTVLVSPRPLSSTSSSRVSPTTSDGKACSRKDSPSTPSSPEPNPVLNANDQLTNINEAGNLGKHFLFNSINLPIENESGRASKFQVNMMHTKK